MHQYLNIKRLLFTLVIITGVIVSCGDSKIQGAFLPGELTWLIYDLGETVQFVNDADSADVLTYTVISRTDSNQIKQYYPIEAEVTLKNNDGDEEITILLLKDQRTFNKYLRVGEVYRSLDLVKPIDGVGIRDETFNNVYILSEPRPDEYTGNIIAVYYSKMYGIIKYITKDEKTYVHANPVAMNFETGQIN